MRAFISSAVVVGLISGCTTPGTEDTRYVGFSEGRFIDDSSNTFKTRFWKPSATNGECLKDEDIFEVRLQSLKINQEFEGFWEKLTSDKGNELGVFLTVSKTKAGEQSVVADAEGKKTKEDATLVRPVERRLVYVTDSRYPRVDINSANLAVFGDKYSGGDYKFTFEVVEFDSESIKKYGTIAKEMAKAAQESGISFNLPYSALLTKMGTALFERVARDDKIISYETQMLKCGSVEDNQASVYMQKGDLAIVRVSQEARSIDWSKYKFNSSEKRLDHGSYILLSIIKRTYEEEAKVAGSSKTPPVKAVSKTVTVDKPGNKP